ncbi:MAG: cytidylate kinase-like family protein [Phycisphaerales bacterium]|nr:cytidylate kinase-like family protein [Phycisphaerales bacterium]
MSSGMSSRTPGLAQAVEQQMRNWELARAQRPVPAEDASAPEVADFVTIARTVASGGGEIARALGTRLRWPVFDRELLDVMSSDDRARRAIYERLDERDVSWLEAMLRSVMVTTFQREDYLHKLTRTVLSLARKGPGVFLGRAADLMLPRDRGLRVYVTASEKRRARAFALRTNITEALAAPEVERIDRERADFRRHHFGDTANELTRYDLVIVMDHFDTEHAVELICAALRARGITH